MTRTPLLALALAACSRDPISVTVRPATAILVEHLDIKTAENAFVQVRCELRGDPDEVHVMMPEEFARSHDVVWAGLRAGGHYDCTATADPGGSVDFEVVAEPLPEGIPEQLEVTKSDTIAMDGVYTLGNIEREPDDNRENTLVVYDPEGFTRWVLPLGTGPDCDVSLEPDGNILYGGGYTYNPTVVGIDGSLVWQAPNGDEGDYDHHVERLPDGNILTLVDATDRVGDLFWRGFRIEVLDGETGEVVWKWSSQDAAERGDLPTTSTSGADLYHANSVSWIEDEDGPAVWVSMRNLSRIMRIDRDSGEVTWSLGPQQDFELVDENGDPAPLADWFYGEHAPEPHPPFLYVYDNGWSRPVDNAFSRVALFEVDPQTRTASVVWAWTETGWYEPIWGDVDLLPSGHLLVTKGHCPTCSTHGVSEILELDPTTDTVVWRGRHPDGTTGAYRHERYDGCALFRNGKYCPELLE